MDNRRSNRWFMRIIDKASALAKAMDISADRVVAKISSNSVNPRDEPPLEEEEDPPVPVPEPSPLDPWAVFDPLEVGTPWEDVVPLDELGGS